MKAYAIVIEGNEVSEEGYRVLSESFWEVENEFSLEKFKAITPSNVNKAMIKDNIKWNYPWEGQITDFSTGLIKSAYSTQNPKARIACALSHYHLWKSCASGSDNYLILEHDSIFTRQLDYHAINKSHKLIISINNPRFATRRAVDYLNTIKSSAPDKGGVVFAPTIDNPNIPQGLPGNSSYIIKPDGAKKMLQLVQEYGLWPNDALMCKQLIPQIGCTQRFYTRVQGIRSTTSL